MYVPGAFRITDTAALYAFVERHGFATIVSSTSTGLLATHVPVLLDRRSPPAVLRAHFARANEHWRAFDGQAEALAIFQGPHAYVSPTWYATGPAVPTWNYAAVHLYGKPRLIAEKEAARGVLIDLVAKYENHRPRPWRIDGVSAAFVDRLLDGIVSFEIPIARAEGKFKLGQNRSVEDRRGIGAGLEAEGSPEAAALAAFMHAAGVID